MTFPDAADSSYRYRSAGDHVHAWDDPVTPRTLVVEDDPDQLELICDAMRMYFHDRPGARVVGARSGAEAMAQDLSQFDAVLLDFQLPDVSGIELLEQILDRRDIPVIFVTGNNSSATAAEAIRRGAQDYLVKLGDYLFAVPVVVEKNIRQHRLKQENRRLQRELEASIEEVRVKNTQLEESLQKMQTMADTDHLTGLANRRAFSEMLDRYYGEANRYDFDLSCAMCDLDRYKDLNDSLGHQVGDRILVTAADVIRSTLRSSDMAARYGGDEFVLLLPHTAMEMAINVADRIRRQLSVATPGLTKARGVTLSIGVASLRSDRPESADALVSMSDRALYVAKDRGKNCIVTYGEIGVLPQTTRT
ncbi:MAG TPA: diguanylate cyclase [Phycisphaerae bacterium]|nr:diguanylate cyclase [Phycisphaerae bacterium]HUU21351.1 diguanylate cyclase [Phycisphaerae bacterium]